MPLSSERSICGASESAHRERAAGENYTLHRRVDGRDLVKRMYLAIYVLLAHATRNELRVLRPEIENKYLFLAYKK